MAGPFRRHPGRRRRAPGRGRWSTGTRRGDRPASGPPSERPSGHGGADQWHGAAAHCWMAWSGAATPRSGPPAPGRLARSARWASPRRSVPLSSSVLLMTSKSSQHRPAATPTPTRPGNRSGLPGDLLCHDRHGPQEGQEEGQGGRPGALLISRAQPRDLYRVGQVATRSGVAPLSRHAVEAAASASLAGRGSSSTTAVASAGRWGRQPVQAQRHEPGDSGARTPRRAGGGAGITGL